MNLRTYQAQSMHEVLAMVKKDLGRDAVILHTRTFRKGGVLGMGGRSIVEVTAATGVNVLPARRRGAGEAAEKAETIPARAEASLRRVAPAAVAAAYGVESRKAGPDDSAAGQRLSLNDSTAGSTVGIDGDTFRDIQKELHTLREVVTQHVAETRRVHGPDLPASLMESYRVMLENQVAEEIAYQVLDTLRGRLAPEQLQDEGVVRSQLRQVVESYLPASGGIELKGDGSARVVAFIGPTGVGKTTTIAKLAANFKLRAHKRVGLITIDTYRIAAVDQLRTYAQILDVPLQVVLTPGDLGGAIRRMSDRDVILIDTAGRSQNDPVRIQELKSFLEAASPDEVHLVLSSAASERNILQAVEKFTEIRVDKVVFTKLDEAVGFGVILNVLKRIDKALSYITMGQDVPDDIAAGSRDELAGLILSGQATLVHRGLAGAAR